GGTRFFDRAEIKNLIAYLRAIANPDDGLSLQRIVNVPARGIGATTVDRIGDLIYERKISAWQALELVSTDEALLGAGPRKKVAAFVEMMRKLRAEGAGLGPASLAEKVLEESGYRDALAGEATLEAEGRIENLLELVAQMREYEREALDPPPTLHGFLERVALASDVDGYDPDKGAVSLMTVHTAKGLEFPVVFITGLEERIFPHARSVDDDSAVEEERRLCYVAVTRARTLLHLSRVRRRRLSGQELPGIPSRFLRDLPTEGVEQIITARPPEYGAYGSSDGRGPWGGRWSRDEEPAYQRRDEFAHLPASRRGDPGRVPAPSRDGLRRAQPGSVHANVGRSHGKPGEIVVEYDADDAAGPGLQVGAKLRHPSFGIGEVRAWQGAGAELKVTMKFAGAGVKTILARFLSKP
ncbi:MAG TPA: 3'-5' exonuclease, partial [Polyangia bacterium]|nr:3'-5' exonuclease [Polyangia bacterium]